MAIRNPRFTQKFDRGYTFYANRVISVQGRRFSRGDLFDKTLVTTRRLRQMWEQRFIYIGEEPLEQVLEPIVEEASPKVVEVKEQEQEEHQDEGEPSTPDTEPKVEKPDFKSLSTEVLRDWLKERGIIMRPKDKHGQLVARAERWWNAEQLPSSTDKAKEGEAA